MTCQKDRQRPSFSAPGTDINYGYLVTNTGNVTLTPVTVTDPMTGLSAITCPSVTLSPGDSGDLHRHLHHHPGRRGSREHHQHRHRRRHPAQRPSRSALSPPSPSPPCSHPAIELAKSSNPPDYASAGTLITYSYTVINSGNVTLHGIAVTDPMAGLSTITCPTATLAPTASETCTATYTTTQADVDRGSLVNIATGLGTQFPPGRR